ncbi:phasin family protein [Lutibaculum baratangense]|uniref:Phasin domain-containing protein n=1 Tax=Lutibaculum baratangense AMV1 TaxID=631454 RepID=V4QUZ9_9HYPH|nr:phasin family protein [Lutibaculum baratangense]ESR23577.1 hypothetical protein N177_3645 [Lutibaculum baratangense AMV1]
MIGNADEFQKLAKDNVDVAMRSFGTLSRNFQGIALDTADYSKKSYEDGAAALEKLMSAKSLDKAFEIQADYLRTSYEGFIAHATKLGEYYVDMTKDAYKPFENLAAKAK